MDAGQALSGTTESTCLQVYNSAIPHVPDLTPVHIVPRP